MVFRSNVLDSEGINVFIGGHYNFPSLPNKFALSSLKYLDGIVCSNKARNNNVLYAFVNDIRFSNFCSVGACELDLSTDSEISYLDNTNMDFKDITTKNIDNYDKQFSFEITPSFLKMLLEDIEKSSLLEIFQLLDDNLRDSTKILNDTSGYSFSALFYLLREIDQVSNIDCNQGLIFALDYFLYTINKKDFIPFSFRDCENQVNMVWEKNIYNNSSKIIRKFSKRNKSKGLIVSEEPNISYYKCKGFNGTDILLRKEERKPYFNAVNKCPLIIATLYYKIVSEYIKNHNKINIYYIIPSYDRQKVNLGTESFIEVFSDDLYLINSNLELNISNIGWGNLFEKVQVIDTYDVKLKSKSMVVYE